MIFDAQSLFSDAQAITADAASTNVIDFGLPGTPQHAAGPATQDIGRGVATPIRIQAVADFDNLTSLAVEVQVCDLEDFSSGVDTVVTSSAVLADLVAGYVFPIMYLPTGLNKRFMRLNYNVTGTNPTTGAITAGFVFGQALWSA